jgi:hypothetical protein
VVLILLLAVAWPRALQCRIAGFEAKLPTLPRSLQAQLLLIGLLAILLRAAFLPWLGAPVPLIHDEQSLMLQAQTYMHGRLANPPHELWPRFESFHINQLPAYASVYFPGRGVPLAFGMLVFGNPWIGVWASFVLLAMSTVWMLRGWIDPRWAFVGGLLVVVRLGAFSYWINSYWGGAFTALGAMLVVGGIPRILKTPRWRYGVAMGLGAVILMTTRPFEGLLLCAAVGAFFLPRILQLPRPAIGSLMLRVALPLTVMVSAGTTWMVLYDSATTGNPFLTPYQLNRSTYAVAPAFIIAPLEKRVSRLEPIAKHIEKFYIDEARPYREAKTGLKGYLKTVFRKVHLSWYFYVGAALTIPFLLGLWVSRRDLPITGTLVIFSFGYFLTTWPLPHYAAPIFPVILIVTMRGLMFLRTWTARSAPVGFSLSRLLPMAAASPLLVAGSSLVLGWPNVRNNSWDRPCCAVAQSSVRTEVIKRLNRVPGRDLVLVKSNEYNPLHTEVVYNDADIDASSIVWAHSNGLERDRIIMDYYSDRRVWLFEWTPQTRKQDQNVTGEASALAYKLQLLPNAPE